MKVQREVFAVAADTTDRLDGVLEKFELSKAINICAWISRFLYNSRCPDQKLSGPLATERSNINKEATYVLGEKSTKEL